MIGYVAARVVGINSSGIVSPSLFTIHVLSVYLSHSLFPWPCVVGGSTLSQHPALPSNIVSSVHPLLFIFKHLLIPHSVLFMYS